MKKIVIDTYGADIGVEVVLSGAARAVKELDIFPIFVGDANEIAKSMTEKGIDEGKYEVVDCHDFIKQSEPPTVIFGGRDESSMALSFSRLKSDDECIALLSPGSTGALLVGSICRLGLLPGLKFPALSSALPCNKGGNLLCLVDCGANIDCSANDLVRFAKMGNVFSKCYCGIESPRVALMSVGREDKKGNALTLEAFSKLKELDMNFIGNAEGSDMFSGYADVIVSDGFSGNLLLKCAEEAGKRAMEIVSEIAGGDSALAEKINQKLFETFDFNSQGAATFLGPKKLVVKMHGSANEDTTFASIQQILRLDNAEFMPQMAEALK